MKFFLFIAFLFLGLIKINSQSPAYINFTTEDGLLTNSVYCVHQDSLGYMWFGTAAGVSRYNGKSFSHFLNETNEKQPDIYSIVDGPDEKMWFVGGKKLWYWEDGKVTEWEFNELLEEYYNLPYLKPIRQLYIDKKCNLHFFIYHSFHIEIDTKGNAKSLPKNDEVFQIENNWFTQHNYPSNSYGDHWCFILKQQNKIDTFTYFQNSRNQYIPNTITIDDSPLFPLANKIILAKKNGELLVKEIGEVLFTYYSANTGTIFVSKANQGIIKLNKNLESIEDYSFAIHNNQTITDLNKNSRGEYWLTSSSNGIYFYPNIDIKNYNNIGKISHLTNFNKEILIGEYIKGIVTIENKKITTPKTPFPNLLLNFRIIDSIPHYFVNTGRGYYIYNDDLEHINHSQHLIDSKCGLNNIQFYRSYSNIYCKNGKNEIKRFNPISDEKANKTFSKIIDFETYDENILISSMKGLKIMTPDTILDVKNINTIIKKDIVTIIEKTNSTYYLGTTKSGVIIWNKDSIINISTNNGLISNKINTLVNDKENLWIGTNKGVQKYNLNTKSFVTIDMKDGLIGNDITSLLLDSTSVYIGTTQGLSIIPYSLFEIQKENPVILLRQIIALKTPNNTNPKLLNYNNNDINFIVDILNNSRFYENTFYKLKGKESNWIDLTSETIRFLSIPPGKFTFEVSYIDFQGKRVIPVSYEFEIRPPFWKTPFFIISIITFLLLSSLFLYKRHFKNVKKNQTMNNQMLTLQQQALSAKMDPHFMFNSLNSIQYFITFDQKTNASKYLVKFTQLMRKHLTYTEDEFIPITNELELIRSYCNLEQIRFTDKFELKIDIKKEVDIEMMQIPSSIIQPIIENAITHGLLQKEGKKTLSIRFEYINRSIIVTIQDNGVGRKQADINKKKASINKKSYAQTLITKKLDVLSEIESRRFTMEIIDLFENNSASGTKVIYHLPLLY